MPIRTVRDLEQHLRDHPADMDVVVDGQVIDDCVEVHPPLAGMPKRVEIRLVKRRPPEHLSEDR